MISGVAVNEEFTTITKSLDTIADRIEFVVDHNQLSDALLNAVALSHQIDALVANLANSCELAGVVARSDQRNAAQFVAARTNTPAKAVRALTRTQKWLNSFPIFRAAFGNELTQAHVDYMRKHLDGSFETHIKLVECQQFFVDTAGSCTFDGFTTAADYWLIHIDPDGKEPTEQLEKNSFSIRTGQGGRGEVKGTLDAATAAVIRNAVNQEANKLRTEDLAAGVQRTNSQRKAAALRALVERGHAAAAGTTAPSALLHIVMSERVAEWALKTLIEGPEDGFPIERTVPVDHLDIDGRCELLDGTPIHPFLALQALGLVSPNGALTPVGLRRYVMDAKSRAIDASVTARIFPEWMKTTLQVQSRGRCEIPGCDAPHHWLQADHVQPSSLGGETRLDQGQSLCQPDNRHKGATPGQAPWHAKPPPQRHEPQHRQRNGDRSSDNDDPDDKPFGI